MNDQKYLRPLKILEIIYIMATRKMSPEANNYVRLDFAIKGPCTECLRDVLQNCVPVGFRDINHALQFLEPQLKQHLESYKYSQLFTNHQLRANFSVRECDMSLVYSLIRNSNWVPPPTRGWGRSFTNSPQDISLAANVERLHLFRNKFEHCKEPSISNQDFNNYWTEVRKCVADIEQSLGSTQHQQSLDHLRGQDLDPEYANRIINEFSDVVRGLQAEQCSQRDSLLEIRVNQSRHGSTLSDITNSLNEQCKDLLDLKTEESNQGNLLRELAVKMDQQYQLLQNDRKVLSDIKTSHDNQAISICEVLSALRDDDKGLVHIVKEQNNQMCTLKDLNKKLEEMHENETLLLNNNRENFKEIHEIMEQRGNEEASCTDSTDMRNQHQNEDDNEEAATDALDCNANRENEISIAEGTDGVICLIKQYAFIKTSLSKRNVKAIVDCFLKEGLISNDEYETIADLYLPRRLRIDHLLKKIILGDSDRLKMFFKVLKSVKPTIARTLATTEVTAQERSRFKQVEERALQVKNASAPSVSECNLDNSDICFFQYHLLAFEEDVDSINDAMLSRFNFSVLDHSNILHAKTPDEKIQKLCQTMNLCSINVENELHTLLRASLYEKWIELRKKRGNHDRQQFLQWLNAPVNLVSYVFGCSRLRFNQAETGSIILKFSIQDGFNMAFLTRGSLQENITYLLWKGYMETQINMIKPVHVTVFIMSPRENGQEEIHVYLDFDTTENTRSREDSEHDIAIQEKKILLEELDPTELSEWITKELDVQKKMIHELEEKLSGSDMHGKEEMIVFLDSICELENGRDLIKQLCKEKDTFTYTRLFVTTDQHATEKCEIRMNQSLRFEKGSVLQKQRYPFQRDMHTYQAESGISSASSDISSGSSDISYWSSDASSVSSAISYAYSDISSGSSAISYGSSDIPQSYYVHKAQKRPDLDCLSGSSVISSWYSDIPQSYSVHKARKTADSEHEFGIQERKLLSEEFDPTELTEWVTNRLDAQKTKIHVFEEKLSRSDIHGKEEMIVLLDNLYELENGRDLIKKFCKQYDPYVYRKLFMTIDQSPTEKHEGPIEKPLQYERGGGLQRLYSFWIDISTDQKVMKKSQETDELLRTIVDKRDDVDENATIKPQNLEVSTSGISSGYSDKPYPVQEVLKSEMKLLKPTETGISSWYSHSSELKPGYNIKKTENEFMEPIGVKARDTAFVLQVGKLDEIWSDVMVIFGSGRSSHDLPRTVIEKVGPQIQREFQDKYPNGLSKEEVVVLSGFNLPVWKIFYCEFSFHAIKECLAMADKLKMRSILFPVQEEYFPVDFVVEALSLHRFFFSISSNSTIYFYVDQDTLEWRKLRKIAEDALFTRIVYSKDEYEQTLNLAVHFPRFHRKPWTNVPRKNFGVLVTVRVDSAFFNLFRTDVPKLSANPESKVFSVGHTTVIIQVGKLEEIQSDTLVFFEVAKGQWPTRNLPSEILEKAGPMIQTEFKQKYPAGLEYAEVAVLNGYNLPFRKILYGVFPRWPDAWLKQVIAVFLTECVQLASDEGITSITFMIPSLTYHVAEIYASVLHSCVEIRIYDELSLSISTQNIVIKDGCIGANMLKKVFEEEWARRIAFKEGHVTVVFRERLLEEILLTTSSGLCMHQLRRGKKTQTCAILSEEPQEKAIISDSKALVIISEFEDITDILVEIGPSLMEEFRTKYPSGLPNDVVAIIDGYNNPFKKIYGVKWTKTAAIIDIILECFQMAENDKMNSIILLIRPNWGINIMDLTRELILGLRIFVIENPSSSIRRLYSDSEILREELYTNVSSKDLKYKIFPVTSVKVFKERNVTVVLNATYDEMEYRYGLYHRDVEGRTDKTNSVVVICGVAGVEWPRGSLCEHIDHILLRDLHFQKGFTSGEVSVLEHFSCNAMRVFFGTAKLYRQDMDVFFNKCLQKADFSRASSVTFLVPKFVRNIKLFASTLSSCVKSFAENTLSTTIKRIHIRTERQNPNFQETKQVFEDEWAKTSGGKQGYPSEDIYLKKAMGYSKVAKKSKEGSKNDPQEEVD